MPVIPISEYTAIENLLSVEIDYGTFGNLAEAVEHNPAWRIIEGGKTTINPITPTSPKIVPITEFGKDAVGLTGGEVGYNTMVHVTEGAGTVTATSGGILAGWTVGTAVAGVLAGAGVGIAAFELAPEFWTDVSNRIFGTDIRYEDIKDCTILGRIQNSPYEGRNQITTFLSEETVKAILECAADYGLFTQPSTGVVTNDEHPNYELYIAKDKLYFELAGSPYQVRVITSTAPVYGFNVKTETAFIQSMVSDETFTYQFKIGSGDWSSPLTASHAEGVYDYWFISNGANLNPLFDYVPPISLFYTSSLDDIYNFIKTGVIDFPMAEGVYELPGNPQIYDPEKTFPENYPDWYQTERITNAIINPFDDPQLYPIPWVPVAMPQYDPLTQPERYPKYVPGADPFPEGNPDSQPVAQQGKLPSQMPDPYQEPTGDIPNDSKDPTTGEKDVPDQDPTTTPTPTPTIIFPTIGGEANALFTVYNPDISMLNSLAGVLWSSNFLVDLMKIFTNNPMDAVISLHMLFATPSTGGNKNIKLGYLDTGISSPYVNKQYIQIDCGTVRIPEYFGDVRDYVNSVADVYLPFVGMRHLKTQDIVGSYVTIKAGVDVFTGTVLYTINIRKSSGINQVMYAFEGNCAVSLPLTGADKSRMFSVLGAAATGAVAGGVAGAAAGAALSIMNGSQQADVQRSGNFGANAGAMGVKKPYIVISRNIGSDAAGYNNLHGYPANKTVKLNSCSGFTRVLDVKLEGLEGATEEDKAEIESLLKSGVLI